MSDIIAAITGAGGAAAIAAIFYVMLWKEFRRTRKNHRERLDALDNRRYEDRKKYDDEIRELNTKLMQHAISDARCQAQIEAQTKLISHLEGEIATLELEMESLKKRAQRRSSAKGT